MTIKRNKPSRGTFEPGLPEATSKLHLQFSPTALDLSSARHSDKLTLRMPKFPRAASAVLAVDAYVLDNPVHPTGHFAWWTFALDADQEATLTLSANGNVLAIKGCGVPLLDHWANGDLAHVPEDCSILLHVVLRHEINNSILSQQSLIAYRDRRALADAKADILAFLPPRSGGARATHRHGFNWPNGSTVHIVTGALPAAGQISAAPSAVLLARELAQSNIPCRLYASEFNPRLRGAVSSTRELLEEMAPSDIVLLLYGGYEPNLSWLRELPCRKAFIHLGVPPSKGLAAFDAEAAQARDLARYQLCTSLDFDVIATTSATAKAELDEVFAAAIKRKRPDTEGIDTLAQGASSEGFSPPEVLLASLYDRAAFWNDITPSAPENWSHPLLVCPARMEPASDILATLKVFDLVCERAPRARLLFASTHTQPTYYEYIHYMLSTRLSRVQGQVDFRTNISDSTFKEVLQSCDGLMQFGPVREEYLADARIFGKPLLTSGQGSRHLIGQPGVYRFHGTVEEQAEAILDVIAPTKPHGTAAPAAGAPAVGAMELLERMLSVTKHAGK